MEININGLIPIEKILNEVNSVFDIVDNLGKVMILKDNRPAYILLKYEESVEVKTNTPAATARYTLHEAMKIVLSEVEDRILHASELADIIYERKLYTQKNGEKAKYNQLSARCGQYPEMFESLSGNYIKLKEGKK